MPWDKNGDAVTFECDDCDKAEACNVTMVRRGSTGPADASDFAVCWQYAQGIGWRSFKRTGHPWTYHCAGCGPAAELAHREHIRQETNRDRLKARHARD